MYKSRRIFYKSIFKSGENKETVELKGNGVVEVGDKIRISFEAEGAVIDILYSEDEIVLKNNQSILRLIKDKMVLNEYQLAYGTTLLKTKLLNCKYRDDNLSIKYELYDSMSLISTVYIVIKMI